MNPIRFSSRFFSLLLLAAAVALFLGGKAYAGTYYWDCTSPIESAGFGTAGGTWGTDLRWSGSNAGTSTTGIQSPAAGDDLNFGYTTTGLAAGTVNVGTVSASNITFAANSGAIVLSGGTITLPAKSTITVNNPADTISSVITGASTNLTKAGTGTLTLNPGAGNTDTLGGLKITTGTLILNSGVLNIPNSATYRLGGSSNPTNIINGGNLRTAGYAMVGGDTVGGKGVFTINSGTWTNTGGNIQIMFGSTGNGSIVNVNGGQVVSAGNIQMGQNPGTATLNLNGGIVIVGSLYNTGSTALLNLNGGVLQPTAASGNFLNFPTGGSVNVLTNGAIFNTAGYNITVGVPLLAGSPSGGLTKLGAGTLTLSGNNSYAGVTTLAAGTLSLAVLANGGANSPIGAASSAASNLVFNGGALSYSGSTSSSDRGFTLAYGTNIITVTDAAATLTLTGGCPTNTVFLKKLGAGTLVLDPGAGSVYSLGSLSADDGTLVLKSGTVTTTRTNPDVAAYVTGAGARGGKLVVDGATLNMGSGTLKPGAAANGNLDILSGTVNVGSLVLGHNGTATSAQSGGTVNANWLFHYDGGTATHTMTGGTLTVQKISNNTAANNVFTLIMNGGAVRAAAGTVNLIDNGGRGGSEVTVQLGTNGATIDTSLSSATIVRPLDNLPGQAGRLTKIGANTLTLTATNTYTGATTVSNGTLAVSGRITQTSSLLMSSYATLQIGLRAPGGPTNIVVNGDVTLAGQISVSDLGIVANTTYPVIAYTGQLTNNGITVAPSMSQWAFTIDTSVPHVVSLIVGQKYPLVQFSSTNSVVTTLTTDLSGTLPGTLPIGPIWYEVRDQANKLWDFGATQARTPWSITVRHLRGGTNTVTVFAKDTTGAIQSHSIQLTVNLGPNTGVRPRPIPSEIWWGGCADNSQMTNYSQWPFVQKYQDGFFFHAWYWMTTQMITAATAATLEQSLATNLLPFNTKYWVELAGSTPTPSTTSAASQLAYVGNVAGVCEANGIIWSEFTHDYHMEDLQPLCQVNPTWSANDQIAWWTGDLTIASGTYPYTSGIWRDVFNGYYARFPHVKVGHTSQPEYWPWDSYPGLMRNDIPFSPQTAHEVIGSFINMAGAIGHPFFSLQSDAPWDFFGGTKYDGSTWASAANQSVMRQKIRVYENYLQSRDCRHTMICNVSDATRGRLGSYDAADIYYENRSLSSMVLHQQEGGRANRYLYESWFPGKAPYAVVPETKVGSYTHLALSGIKYLKGIADINGNLEQLSITPTATNGTVVQLQLQNNGDVMCLPALAGQAGTVPGVTTRYFATNGTELTATVLTAEGLCYTNMLQPGAIMNLFAVTLASGIAATTNGNSSLEAFWNPQDPLGIVRDRELFATTLNPLGSWQDADIGSVGLTGGSALSGTHFTLLGSGADISGTADAFHFVWQTNSGDGTLTARVISQTAADVGSKAGVMIRESAAADARNVFVCVTPGNGVSFQNRAASGGASSANSLAGMVAPYWVRLTRSGTMFTALCSSNGVDWVTAGSSNLTGFENSALWGLAVTAHNSALASASTFDNVTLSDNTNTAPVLNPIADRTLIAGQTLTFTNVATDADLPPQTLTFSLIAPPPGATVNSSNGIFNWRPTLAQSPATHPFSVNVTDSGTPSLSATQTFLVTVTQPARPATSALAFSNGQFRVTISGDSGPDYMIYASTNLIDWLPVWTNKSAQPPFIFIDSANTEFKSRFFRVGLGP